MVCSSKKLSLAQAKEISVETLRRHVGRVTEQGTKMKGGKSAINCVPA